MNEITKIFLLLFLSITWSVAQTDSSYYYDESEYTEEPRRDTSYFSEELTIRKIDRDEWNELIKDVDYSEKELKKRKRKEKEFDSEFSEKAIVAFGTFLKFLVIGLGIAVVIYVIVKLITGKGLSFKRDRKLKANGSTYELDEIEENLPDVELQSPIEKAIEDENYSLAVRLYYLSVIQELSAKDIIKWKREKTNFEYLREMRNHRLNSDFQNLTQIYERIWYGDNEISKAIFLQIQPIFSGMLKQLKKLPKAVSG